MAMNPMQRRSMNMFLLGILITAAIMAVVVAMLVKQVKGLNQQILALQKLQSSAYVAAKDLESGQNVDFEDNFSYDVVQTTLSPDELITESDFYEKTENGDPLYGEDGEQIKKKVMFKTRVPAGSIITKDMIVNQDDPVTSTDRIQEYGMISLPSHLVNGDYIDIRIALTNGQDYIILSKKKVLGCTSTSIWLKVNEAEMQILNSAIIESYMISGAKLNALGYIEPGMQTATTPSYTTRTETISLLDTLKERGINLVDEINKDENKAYLRGKTALEFYDKYTKNAIGESARAIFNDASSGDEGQVAAGYATEKAKMQESRDAYISTLDETMTGYSAEE